MSPSLYPQIVPTKVGQIPRSSEETREAGTLGRTGLINAMWRDPQIEIGSLYTSCLWFVSRLPEKRDPSCAKCFETLRNGIETYCNKVGVLLPFAFLWSHNKFHQIKAAARLTFV